MKQPLAGYVFVFTGETKIPRDEAQSRVTLLGARCTTALSSKTTHLVTGSEPGPAKLAKAAELGITVLTEDSLMELLEQNEDCMDSVIHMDIEGQEVPQKTDPEPQDTRSWAEKYRPTTTAQLVGNTGLISELKEFVCGGTKTFHAALLSGPPGCGKTTAAHVVCREAGLEVVEFNASDLRNKKSIAEQMAGAINSAGVMGRRVVVMDEVDGMSGDRGGLPELVSVIKKASTPIICICNDRNSPVIRTLASHCLDLRFRRLDHRTMATRLREILRREGKQITDGVLSEVVTKCTGDFRYTLNVLQNIAQRGATDARSIERSLVRKIESRGPFELAAELFKRAPVKQKLDVFFEDYSILPLFVHENYVKCIFKSMRDFSASADAISFSDLVDTRIQREQEWTLLPLLGYFGCVQPLREKTLMKRIDFPAFLGSNSRRTKNQRLLGEFCSHLRFATNRDDARRYISELVYKMFMGAAGREDFAGCVRMLEDSGLQREDVLAMEDVLGESLYKGVPAKAKTQLTRECKRIRRAVTYVPAVQTEEEVED